MLCAVIDMLHNLIIKMFAEFVGILSIVFFIAADIVKLATYLKEHLRIQALPEQPSYEEYRKTVLLVLARLVTYNRRRPGEVQALR